MLVLVWMFCNRHPAHATHAPQHTGFPFWMSSNVAPGGDLSEQWRRDFSPVATLEPVTNSMACGYLDTSSGQLRRDFCLLRKYGFICMSPGNKYLCACRFHQTYLPTSGSF